MSFGGSSGGSSSIAGGTDVLLSNPATDQVLAYDGSTAKWKNSSIVTSAIQTVVYDGTAWPATRTSAVARFFISTGYPTAPAPVGLQQCDLWFRDPGAS